KGGHLFIEAMPMAADALGPLHATFAGDGPEMQRWQALATRAAVADPRLTFEFTGWVDEPRKRDLFERADVAVVPSILPEPYGLVGPEAARFGVPAVAFDVGGISDWLCDGKTGCLAPGDPPTARGLAAAIVRCLKDFVTTRHLAAGAREAAALARREDHVAA